MAIIEIKSDNPQLSYVLKKNPATGLVGKSNREANCFGYYVNEQHYVIVNLLKPESLSFTQNKEFNYLDYSVETEGMSYLTSMNTLIRDALKKPAIEDVEHQYQTEVTMLCLYISKGLSGCLKEAFNEITFTPLIDNRVSNVALYKVSVKTDVSIKAALEIAYLIAALACPKKGDYINANFVSSIINTLRGKGKINKSLEPSKKSLIETIKNIFPKQQKVITSSVIGRQYPYSIINQINSRLVKSREIFDLVKSDLEELCNLPCSLTYRGVSEQRVTFINCQFVSSLSLIDIGCGEGNYFYLAKKLNQGLHYYPIEKEEDLHPVIDKKRKRFSEVIKAPLLNVEQLQIEEPVQVLITEVLEHNSKDEALNLINYVLSQFEVKRLIITVPNGQFNTYYGIQEGHMRHDDHQWEPSFNEFNEFIVRSSILNSAESYEFSHIGDVVNGVTPTIGLVINY